MSGNFLRRLGSGDSGPRASESPTAAILAHLRVLLNARQGDAATAPTFGMVDFTRLVHSPQSGQAPAASIRATILEYEPRLRNVAVRPLGSTDQLLVLRFEITAALADRASREVLRFTTQVLPGGHIELL